MKTIKVRITADNADAWYENGEVYEVHEEPRDKDSFGEPWGLVGYVPVGDDKRDVCIAVTDCEVVQNVLTTEQTKRFAKAFDSFPYGSKLRKVNVNMTAEDAFEVALNNIEALQHLFKENYEFAQRQQFEIDGNRQIMRGLAHLFTEVQKYLPKDEPK